MKNFYDVLHNFISPVTGYGLADPDYVPVGNGLGIAIPSPDLIDLRLDQINLRMDYDTLSSAYFIVGFENAQMPNAQVLYNMADGYLYNTAGIVSTTPTIPVTSLPNLTEHNVWVGNDVNRPVETQRLNVLNLPNLTEHNVWVGNDVNIPVETQRLNVLNLPAFFQPDVLFTSKSIPPGAPVNFGINNLYIGNLPITPNLSEPIEPELTLRLDTSNLPNLPRGKMWLGIINATPPYIATIPTPPYIEVIGSLNWDGRGALVPPPFVTTDYAVPQAVGLNPNELFIGNTDVLYYGEITKTVALNIVNLPNLTEGKVWQGNVENRPIEVSVASNEATYIIQKADGGLPNAQSLGTLSTGLLKNNLSVISSPHTGTLSIAVSGVDYINLTQYEALQAEILELYGDVALLQFQVARIEEQILFITEVTIAALALLVAGLEGQIIVLQGEVNTINTRIDNLRLNTIQADGDVSFYSFKLVNLADPSGPQDGATKHYVDEAIAGITPNITLTGFVTGGPPVSGVISTIRTPGDLDMGGDRVKNLRQDPVEDLDAVSMTFLWNLLNGELEILWP